VANTIVTISRPTLKLIASFVCLAVTIAQEVTDMPNIHF